MKLNKIKKSEFKIYSQLYSRKNINIKKFNIWWAKKIKFEIYKRYIIRLYKKQKILFSRFKRNQNQKKWFFSRRIIYNINNYKKLKKYNVYIYNYTYNKEISTYMYLCIKSGFHISNISKIRINFIKHIKFYRNKKKICFFNYEIGINSFKNSLFFSKLSRNKKGNFLLINTRREDNSKIEFRKQNALYAKQLGAYYIKNKWLGGNLTNIIQPTLQKNIQEIQEISLTDFFRTIFYERKKKKRIFFKIPDITVIFEGIHETYGYIDSNTLKVPSIAATDKIVNNDNVFYPIYFSHNNNNCLHIYNTLFLKKINDKNQ